MSDKALEKAREAKELLMDLFAKNSDVVGVGVVSMWVVKINTINPELSIPLEVAGVPVIKEVTGVISKQEEDE